MYVTQFLCEASITLERAIELVVWPVVVFLLGATAIFLYRKTIQQKIDELRQVSMPGKGSLIFSRDMKQIEQLAASAQSSETSHELSKLITVLDARSLRILRALFDEEKGRLIANYKKHYRAELHYLLKEELVQELAGYYSLTEKGEQLTRQYLLHILAGSD